MSFSSASEESHTGCARTYGNTPCKQEDYPRKILLRTDVLIQDGTFNEQPSLNLLTPPCQAVVVAEGRLNG